MQVEWEAHRGNKGPFGIGRSSKSRAIFAAAWKPYNTEDVAQPEICQSAWSGHPRRGA
jgi:hypothetical protein